MLSVSAVASVLLLLVQCAAPAAAQQPAVPIQLYECQPPFCAAVPVNLTQAVEQRAAPGMAVGIINSSTGAPLLVASAGRFTYDGWSSLVTNESLYDMASCTKIIATTTAAAILYQKGLLDLDERVSSPRLLGPDFASLGKGAITVRNLLLHNAGFPPDPNPGYSSPIFPCPQNANYHPGQEYSCDALIYDNLVFNQTIVTPPGDVFVYSDLSMITLMFVVGKVVQANNLVVGDMVQPCFDRSNLVCLFNTFVQQAVFQRYGMSNTGFVPQNAELCPPQWNDPWYHHELIKGYVSDQNAYALGGIAGHAGVFTNIHDGLALMKVWLYATDPAQLNATTIQLWTAVANLTQSSRALGWDTNDQAYKWCGSFSKRTFLHIGYTGTELCADPELGVATVVLANGRYPDYKQDGMIWYRPNFNTFVHDLYVSSR